MSNTPSNEDIDLLVRAYLGDCGPQANRVYSFVTAVLARWGTPQPVVREPLTDEQLAEMMRDTWGCASIAPRHALAFARAVERAHGITQAGAVPLTCDWTHNEDDGFWETACGEAWRFDDGGPGENNMHFCHSCGNSLRIKGGQHGTE